MHIIFAMLQPRGHRRQAERASVLFALLLLLTIVAVAFGGTVTAQQKQSSPYYKKLLPPALVGGIEKVFRPFLAREEGGEACTEPPSPLYQLNPHAILSVSRAMKARFAGSRAGEGSAADETSSSCSSHGTYWNGTCVCKPYWGGEDCGVQEIALPSKGALPSLSDASSSWRRRRRTPAAFRPANDTAATFTPLRICFVQTLHTRTVYNDQAAGGAAPRAPNMMQSSWVHPFAKALASEGHHVTVVLHKVSGNEPSFRFHSIPFLCVHACVLACLHQSINATRLTNRPSTKLHACMHGFPPSLPPSLTHPFLTQPYAAAPCLVRGFG